MGTRGWTCSENEKFYRRLETCELDIKIVHTFKLYELALKFLASKLYRCSIQHCNLYRTLQQTLLQRKINERGKH